MPKEDGFKFMGSVPPTVDSALFMSEIGPNDKLIVMKEDEFMSWRTTLKWAAFMLFLCGVALGMIVVSLLWVVTK
jgi:hypothetical protein